jgi:hypothetical protein
MIRQVSFSEMTADSPLVPGVRFGKDAAAAPWRTARRERRPDEIAYERFGDAGVATQYPFVREA